MKSHPICQAAVAPLCVGLGNGRDVSPAGRAPGATAEVTGRLCSPVPRSKHGHRPGNGLWENAVSCGCAVKCSPCTSGHQRDSSPLLLPHWVPAQPRDANAELKHNPFPGNSGVWRVFSWISLPLYTGVSLDHHNFCKDSIFKR